MMIEPVTAVALLLGWGGTVAANLVSGIAGNEAHRGYLAILEKAMDRRIDPKTGLPRNHDLMHAANDALSASFQVLLLRLSSASGERKPLLPQFGTLWHETPLARWVAAVAKASKKAPFGSILEQSLDPKDISVSRCLEEGHICGQIQPLLVSGVTRWLNQIGRLHDAPAEWEPLLENGWKTGDQQVTLAMAFCLFFRENLKGQEKVFRIHVADVLAELRQNVSGLQRAFESKLDEELGPIHATLADMKTLLVGFNDQLSDIRSSQDDIASAQEARANEREREMRELLAEYFGGLFRILAAENGNGRSARAGSTSPDSHSSSTEVLARFLESERAKSAVVHLPLIASNGLPLVLQLGDLRIDLPLIVSHEHASRPDSTSCAWRGKDPTWIHDHLRNSHTWALMVDRSQYSEDIARDCLIQSRLTSGSRTVILGAPGCGKSTLLEWIARHYVKTYGSDAESETPESSLTDLPRISWLPILILCREWGRSGRPVPDQLSALLRDHFSGLQFSPTDTEILIAHVEDLLDEGKVLLLVDGLDEFHDPQIRLSFAEFLASVSCRFPRSTLVVTSRVIGFQAVQQAMTAGFDHLVVGPLDRNAKDGFIQKWGSVMKWDSTRLDQTIKSVCDRRRLAKLTDTIFMLALVIQIQSDKMPERQVDIYRRSVELMIQRRRSHHTQPVVPNELLPHLEFLAFEMGTNGTQRIHQNKVVAIFDRLRELEDEAVLSTRSPTDLLQLCIDSIGLLNIVGTEMDSRGYERPLIQFFHQSFQEYFSSQAMIHGRGSMAVSSLVDRLQNLLSTIELRDNEIILSGNKKFVESVFADSWQETIRQFIADLPTHEADNAIELLLPDASTPARELRARSIFALQCLADEPRVSDRVLNRVLDAVIENLEEVDCFGNKNRTMMDDTIEAIGKSELGEPLRNRLIEEFISVEGPLRMRAGLAYYKAAGKGNFSLDGDKIEATLKDAKMRMESSEVPMRVATALNLLDLFFSEDGKLGGLQPEHRSEFIDMLLGGLSRDPATIAASVWALVWFTGAKLRSHSVPLAHGDEVMAGSAVTLLPEQLDRVESLMRQGEVDSRFVPLATLLFSRNANVIPVMSQYDWAYSIAVVADGGKARRDLPAPVPSEMGGTKEWLLSILESSKNPKILASTAMVLGSFGVFVPQMVPPLGDTFRDNSQPEEYRDEAWAYLAMIGDAAARDIIESAADESLAGGDDYLRFRGFLGLLLLDDVELLAKQIRKMQPDTDLFAYAYGMGGSRDPRGISLLQELREDPDERISNAAKKALAKPWASLGDPEPGAATSSVSERLLSSVETLKLRTSKLIMTYRARDERSNDFFAYILSDEAGVRRMKSDFLGQIAGAAKDYGEVIYADFVKDPDDKAKDFLKKWLKKNKGTSLDEGTSTD